MLKVKRTKKDWLEIFQPKHGHILWNGWAADPYNPEHAYTSSHAFVEHMSTLGFFKSGNKVLDVGCGNGRLCIGLSEKNISYFGFDVMKPCIDFCQKVFKGFSFQHIDIFNSCSNPTGVLSPFTFIFPYADNSFDDIITYSVFTHLQHISVASHYIDEIKRVLKPSGRFFSSWYRSPPNDVDSFVGRTVYLEKDIFQCLEGFEVLWSHGGHTTEYYNQLAVAAYKK